MNSSKLSPNGRQSLPGKSSMNQSDALWLAPFYVTVGRAFVSLLSGKQRDRR